MPLKGKKNDDNTVKENKGCGYNFHYLWQRVNLVENINFQFCWFLHSLSLILWVRKCEPSSKMRIIKKIILNNLEVWKKEIKLAQ